MKLNLLFSSAAALMLKTKVRISNPYHIVSYYLPRHLYLEQVLDINVFINFIIVAAVVVAIMAATGAMDITDVTDRPSPQCLLGTRLTPVREPGP